MKKLVRYKDRYHKFLVLVAVFGLSSFIIMPVDGMSCPSVGCMQEVNSINNVFYGMNPNQSATQHSGMVNSNNHTLPFAGTNRGYYAGQNVTVSNPNNGTVNAYQYSLQVHNNTIPNSGRYNIVGGVPPSYSLKVTITTDQTYYSYGDMILISGRVSPVIEGLPLDIVMKGQNSQIPVGDAYINSDGSFSDQVRIVGPQWSNAANYYTVTAQYGSYTYSGTTFYFSKPPASNIMDSTNTNITPSFVATSAGTSLTLSVQVIDISQSGNRFYNFGSHYLPSVTTGSVTWNDNGAGGIFNPPSCTLSSGSCMTSYTPSLSPPSTITITASYSGDSGHLSSSGIASLTTNQQLHTTSTTITPSSGTTSAGSASTFSVQVTDTSSMPTIATGTVSWSDNGAGGTFSSATCVPSSGSCDVSYTPSSSPPSTITITASYGGDSTHSASSGTASLTTTTTLDQTTTTVTASPTTLTSGSANTLTASVVDNSNPSSSMIGTISWSDNGAGGIFSSNTCALSGNQCALTYTPPSNLPTSITITATYGGDAGHTGSSSTASLSASSSESSGLTVTTDRSSYSAGGNVTITVYSPSVSSGEDVAILVMDPSSNIVSSRTIGFNSEGYAQLVIRLIPNALSGTYQIAASSSYNGNYLAGSASFTVTSGLSTPSMPSTTSSTTSGLTIVSVQPTNQLGSNVVTSYTRGTTGFAKVVVSSTSSQSALITVNLVGSDGTSLGVGSINTSLGTGTSQMIVSFYIPSSAANGTANIYADMFSNWPSNGGVPLTPELSSSIIIQ